MVPKWSGKWVCYGSEGSAEGLKKNTLFNPLKSITTYFSPYILSLVDLLTR